jgi:hypothetical protein
VLVGFVNLSRTPNGYIGLGIKNNLFPGSTMQITLGKIWLLLILAIRSSLRLFLWGIKDSFWYIWYFQLWGKKPTKKKEDKGI